MTLEGEYAPSRAQWVREQVDAYESSGGQRANTLRDTGLPVIIVTMRGNKSGKVRKIALMRVEHGGEYALVASMGGAPRNPVWCHNLKADPEAVTIQDGPEPFAARGAKPVTNGISDLVPIEIVIQSELLDLSSTRGSSFSSRRRALITLRVRRNSSVVSSNRLTTCLPST